MTPAEQNTDNATFGSHTLMPVELSPDANVCAIAQSYVPEMVQRLWNIDAVKESKYVVMGIGSRCSLVGSERDALFTEAPVHFSDNQMTNPKVMYCRYLIVVELKQTNETTATARYLGTCIPGPNGLDSITEILKGHYDNTL
ncbi:MAG: hypothetical protein R3C03_07165 [Pirellulaceae bacterium]